MIYWCSVWDGYPFYCEVNSKTEKMREKKFHQKNQSELELLEQFKI